MAYNNGFPVSYQTAYYQPQYVPQYQQIPQNQQNQQNTGVIWVQGEAGAKSYLVAPNTTVQLWDSENQTIYLKSADASGMPSIKTLDYTVRELRQNEVPVATHENVYVEKGDFEALKSEVLKIKTDLAGLVKDGKSSV